METGAHKSFISGRVVQLEPTSPPLLRTTPNPEVLVKLEAQIRNLTPKTRNPEVRAPGPGPHPHPAVVPIWGG
jgi:hypothetical protein